MRELIADVGGRARSGEALRFGLAAFVIARETEAEAAAAEAELWEIVKKDAPDHERLQMAERIDAFHQAGIEPFMLQFQPFEPEMRRFAAEVLPRVRRLGAVTA